MAPLVRAERSRRPRSFPDRPGVRPTDRGSDRPTGHHTPQLCADRPTGGQTDRPGSDRPGSDRPVTTHPNCALTDRNARNAGTPGTPGTPGTLQRPGLGDGARRTPGRSRTAHPFPHGGGRMCPPKRCPSYLRRRPIGHHISMGYIYGDFVNVITVNPIVAHWATQL
jgi:hypothetical protein